MAHKIICRPLRGSAPHSGLLYWCLQSDGDKWRHEIIRGISADICDMRSHWSPVCQCACNMQREETQRKTPSPDECKYFTVVSKSKSWNALLNGVKFSPPSCRSSLYEGRVGGVCGSSSVSSQQQLPASARGRSAPVAVYTQSWCWPPAAPTLTTETASSADSGPWSLSCHHQWPHQHQWLCDTPRSCSGSGAGAARGRVIRVIPPPPDQ